MEKDKDIIEVIIDEQPTNNKKIKFAYWDNLAKDLFTAVYKNIIGSLYYDCFGSIFCRFFHTEKR